MRSSGLMLRAVLGLFIGVYWTMPSSASDGVIEVNQACAIGPGCPTGDAPGMPVTISTPGHYRLTSNLEAQAVSVSLIDIDSSDVTLDLNGFSLQGDVICSETGGTPNVVTCTAGTTTNGIRVPGPHLSVAIRNGQIRGMDESCLLAINARNVNVQDLAVSHCGDRGISLGLDSSVRNTSAILNGGSGIVVGARGRVVAATVASSGQDGISTSSWSRVSSSFSGFNNGKGIVAGNDTAVFESTSGLNGGSGIQATGSLVSRSRVALNRADGINLDTGIVMDTTSNANVLNGIACGRLCRLENNVAVFNPMSGIVVGRGSNVSRNTIDGNGADGIRVTGASAIIENTARSNGGDGIDCTGGGKSSVRDNTSVENAGIGLNLSDLAIQDPVYRGNAVVDNTSATVSGGNNVGDNTCIALGIVSTCP